MAQVDFPHVVLLGKIGSELAEKEVYVVLALAQGGHHYLYGIQPVVEILAEFPLSDRIAQVHVGRGNDADVRVADLRCADPRELSRLQHAQQLCLIGQRQFPDLVKEERSLVRHLEISLAGLDCARERAFFMSVGATATAISMALLKAGSLPTMSNLFLILCNS